MQSLYVRNSLTEVRSVAIGVAVSLPCHLLDPVLQPMAILAWDILAVLHLMGMYRGLLETTTVLLTETAELSVTRQSHCATSRDSFNHIYCASLIVC